MNALHECEVVDAAVCSRPYRGGVLLEGWIYSPSPFKQGEAVAGWSSLAVNLQDGGVPGFSTALLLLLLLLTVHVEIRVGWALLLGDAVSQVGQPNDGRVRCHVCGLDMLLKG